jgi:hypothetical protein
MTEWIGVEIGDHFFLRILSPLVMVWNSFSITAARSGFFHEVVGLGWIIAKVA